MVFRRLGPDSAAAAIFQHSAGDSSQGEDFSSCLAQTGSIQCVKKDGGAAKVLLSFLDLPAEIRMDIYKLLLVSSSTISFFQPYDPQRGQSCSCRGDLPLAPLRRTGGVSDIHLQILRTCRQVQAEATSILYGDNRYSFPCPKDLERFSRDIRSTNAASLRNISADHSNIDCSVHDFWFFHTQTALSATPGLAEFSADFAVRWNARTPSFFVDALVCMNLVLQTHPRLKKLVLRRPSLHAWQSQNRDIFTLVLVCHDYKLKSGTCFEVAFDGYQYQRDGEVKAEDFIDIEAELAILRKLRPGQIGAGSVFL